MEAVVVAEVNRRINGNRREISFIYYDAIVIDAVANILFSKTSSDVSPVFIVRGGRRRPLS